jgi:hypothetical protein
MELQRCLDILALTEHLDILALTEHLDTLVCLGIQVSLDILDILEWVVLDTLVLELMALQDGLVTQVFQDSLVLQATLDSLVLTEK